MAKFICNMISYTLQRTVDITVIIPSPTIPESMGMGPKPHGDRQKSAERFTLFLEIWPM